MVRVLMAVGHVLPYVKYPLFECLKSYVTLKGLLKD